MRRLRADGYEIIGSDCVPFQSRISLDEAVDLKEYLVHEHFMSVPNIRVTHTDTESRIAHAKSFPNKFVMDMDDHPSLFGSAMLKNIDADTWRLVIMQTRMKRGSEDAGQQRFVTRYNVEVYNDEIVEAVKKMQIVRDIGVMTVDSIVRQMDESSETESDSKPQFERLAFERYMEPRDCATAKEFLGRVCRRIVAVG
jgi:hypothetical protein